MSEPHAGVGVNGEPDDFSARYDRMLIGSTTPWIAKTLLAGALLLAAILALGSVLDRLLGL